MLEFRRRHSTLDSRQHESSSIILRPSIFRTNFRPLALQVRDYSRAHRMQNEKPNPFFPRAKQLSFVFPIVFEDSSQAQLNRSDSCLTPATDSDSPLLIEEYHQLYRIVILHQLEDARESMTKKNESNPISIEWDGAVNDLSYNVLIQFRVLYNIPVLSDSLM